MKKFLTILLKLFIILVGILLGGAMLLTCWLIPLPPGEAYHSAPGVSVSCTTFDVPGAPPLDTWHVIHDTSRLDTWNVNLDPYILTPDTWNMTLFTEETWTTNHLA